MTYPITGIPVPEGQPLPQRQEVGDWFKNGDKKQVSLFIQALTSIKAKPVEDKLSYFQIASIHSYPLQLGWDGEPAGEYCVHGQITFPTWHRPYVLLLEQVLYQEMQIIINGFDITQKEKDEWLQASTQFRLPYWDWARQQEYDDGYKGYGVPEVFTKDQISIISHDNTTKNVPNPLVKYVNPKLGADKQPLAMGDWDMGMLYRILDNNNDYMNRVLPWSFCEGTSRYGILEKELKKQWAPGVNNWRSCNAGLSDPQWYGVYSGGCLAEAVARMLTPGYLDDYVYFASTAHNNPKDVNNASFLSLEYIHNIIHNMTGGQYMYLDNPDIPKGFQGRGLGHMSDVTVAAFDPIFWFHHCNVDRLLAIWQTLNPGSWFPNGSSNGDPGAGDPLLPFHYDEDPQHLWDSNRGRDWRSLGYDYDDLAPPADTDTKDDEDKGNYSHESHGKRHFHDYIINVLYNPYALKGRAYSILFFIESKADQIPKTFIGNISTFTAPVRQEGSSVACLNCVNQSTKGVLRKAQVPVTLQLVDLAERATHGIFGSLEPALVERDLEQALSWSFHEIGGAWRHPHDFPGTEIAVLNAKVTLPKTPDGFASYGRYTKLRRATQGKPRGSRGTDDDKIKDD